MSNVADPLERSSVAASQTYGKQLQFLKSEYTGQLKDGFRHGLGKSTTTDGCSYIGEWSNNEYHGFGTFVNSINNSYSGRFKAGKMHEGGVVKTVSGDRYDVEYNEGLLLFSKKINGKGDTKLVGLAENAKLKVDEAIKVINNGGVVSASAAKSSGGMPPKLGTNYKKPKANVKRTLTEENFSDASVAVKKAQAAGTIEIFGDEEEEPAARPSGVGSSDIRQRDDEVQYADPSQLVHIPAIICDRMDWHWEELSSSEAAKFLTAYGSDGSFLVRTRPMSPDEHALAALLQGSVHHFKFEVGDGWVMLGGVKKKTIPLLLAFFLKNKIYQRSNLLQPLPPYIDIIKKLAAQGFSRENAIKAFKATRNYDIKVLAKHIRENYQ